MRTFFIKKDFDVEADKGSDGMYQVISVTDDEGNDLSGKLGTGLFFENDDMFIRYLRENTDIDSNEEVRILEDN